MTRDQKVTQSIVGLVLQNPFLTISSTLKGGYGDNGDYAGAFGGGPWGWLLGDPLDTLSVSNLKAAEAVGEDLGKKFVDGVNKFFNEPIHIKIHGKEETRKSQVHSQPLQQIG